MRAHLRILISPLVPSIEERVGCVHARLSLIDYVKRWNVPFTVERVDGCGSETQWESNGNLLDD